MAGLSLKHIYKVYPNGVKAVNDFCMDIADREFIVFVGPSGCGKSTTLRMIAGLEEISAGELYIGGELVNEVEPAARDVAMVFQNYALYPHMSVYKNMAFGLQLRKIPKDEIDRRVREAAEILGITEFLERKPKALSGGQRQRVALGRAIVREPKVFLLDEPLSNLDAKLRTQMRTEIAKLHAKLNTTFIYVTHDQVEAMTMGTRIVVMKEGRIQQIDTPYNLYNYPCNKFVAGFIGTPQMSFLPGGIYADGQNYVFKINNTNVAITAPCQMFTKLNKKYVGGKNVVFGLRPEHISIDPALYPYTAECVVTHVEDLGVESHVFADFGEGKVLSLSGGETAVTIKAPAGCALKAGDKITVSVNLSALQIFDGETEITALPRVPDGASLPAKITDGKLYAAGCPLPLPKAFGNKEGEYTLFVPTEAFTHGGPIKAEETSREEIDGRTLLRLTADGQTFYAFEGDSPFGGSVGIDFAQCTLSAPDGAVVAEAVPRFNALPAKVVALKDKTYALEFACGRVACPMPIYQKLRAALGREVLKAGLSVRFAPSGVLLAEEGFKPQSAEIKDYCGEIYSVCELAGGGAVVKGDASGGFLPDLQKAQIYLCSPEVKLI